MAIDLCDLANILDKIFHSKPWKWLLEHQDFKIFQGKNPQTRQAVHPIGTHVIRWWLKNTLILHTQKVGQSGLHNFFKLQFFFLQRGIDLYILHLSQL